MTQQSASLAGTEGTGSRGARWGWAFGAAVVALVINVALS